MANDDRMQPTFEPGLNLGSEFYIRKPWNHKIFLVCCNVIYKTTANSITKFVRKNGASSYLVNVKFSQRALFISFTRQYGSGNKTGTPSLMLVRNDL